MNSAQNPRHTAAACVLARAIPCWPCSVKYFALPAMRWWQPLRRKQIQEHIENTDFDVIILNHTLSFADRKALARKTKQRNPNNGVLVLHHSGSSGQSLC